MRLRTPERQGWLHLSWHPIAARVCVGAAPDRGAASEAFSFVEQVSGQLRGLVLCSASVPLPWERLAQLDFAQRPGEVPSRRLFCEIMGKYSNLVLADGSGEVLQAAYQVGSKMSRQRQVQQGRPYGLPPSPPGVPPSIAETLDEWRSNVSRAAALLTATRASHSGGGDADGAGVAGVADGCVRAYSGVSPALAEQLCAAAGVAGGADPGPLGDAEWGALHRQWQAWLARLASGSFAASSDAATGRYSVLGTCPISFPSVHALIDSVYSELQAAEAHAALHARLAGAVRNGLKRARGRAAAFQKQLAAAADADAVQRRADIIMANLYRLAPGATDLEAEDWDSGEQVRIELPKEQTAVEAAEALFRRARKLRRALAAVAPLAAEAQEEITYLEEVEDSLAQLAEYRERDDWSALQEVRAELVGARLMPPPPDAVLAARGAARGRKAAKKGKAGGGGGGATASAGFRRFVSPGGFVVLVGRNNKQNDVLSHQVAHPGDLWMHVRGSPGSHVLLRCGGGGGRAHPGGSAGSGPGDDDVQFAADLAAWFSKLRTSGKADVITARAGALKKPKGAKPGQVMVSREEGNVVGRPERGGAVAAGGSGGVDR